MYSVKEASHEVKHVVDAEGGRSATVTFKDGHFIECRFHNVGGVYNLDDWKFLGRLSQTIQELDAKYKAPIPAPPSAAQERTDGRA